MPLPQHAVRPLGHERPDQKAVRELEQQKREIEINQGIDNEIEMNKMRARDLREQIKKMGHKPCN